jgi:hypothetical protein
MILKAEQPLEKPFVFGLSAVIGDVEALIAASETAITSNGLNFRADSQVYKEFVTLIADFKQLTPVAISSNVAGTLQLIFSAAWKWLIRSPPAQSSTLLGAWVSLDNSSNRR